METKKSVVRSAIFKKTGTGKYGEYHIFEITFDNNDKGDYLAKTIPQTVFLEGKEIDYTIEEKVNGQYKNYSIKPVQTNGFVPGKGNPAYEHKRTALKCATDLVCAGKVTTEQLIPSANKFMDFLNG